MKKLFLTHRSFRFRRFTNKAYSAFASLHKQVTIGAVKAYVTEREMLKQGISVAAMLAMLFGFGAVQAAETEGESTGVPLTDAEQLRLQEVLVVSHKAAVHSEAYRLVTSVSRSEIEALPVQTVADILQYLPGLDVRTRGAGGGQADLSMRGGTFDQVLVLLNGVPVSDAQTGHYSLNLPVSKSLIERIEVLQGTGAGLFGAFSGAINIVVDDAPLAPISPSRGTGGLSLTAGMNGLVNPEISGRWTTKHGVQMAASAEYSRYEGYYAPNPTEKEQTALNNTDLKLANIYYSIQIPVSPSKVEESLLPQLGKEVGERGSSPCPSWGKGTGERGRLFAQLSLQYKDAGAGMFYGSSVDQFDATRTAFGSLDYTHRWGAWSLEAQASYRANYDRYEWHRGQRPDGNFHFSQTSSAALKTHYASRIGKTTFGAEFRNENLHSTNLGDTINPDGQVPNVKDFNLHDVRVLDLVKGKNRMQVGYFAEQSFFWNNLSASVGFNGLWNSMFGNQFGGGVNLGYEYAKNSSVYVNANRSLRMPTFTDLYYKAGQQRGNRDLQPETAWLLSLGTKCTLPLPQLGKGSGKGTLSFFADYYFRWGKNIIDWIFDESDQLYHAQNWNTVNATGLEAGVEYRLNDWLPRVSAQYAYTWQDIDVSKTVSSYLDYLSHKLILTLNHGIWNGMAGGRKHCLGAEWSLRFQKREGQYKDVDGNPQDYQPTWLLDGSLYYECERVRIAVDCTNLTNRRYYDYGGILQPGIWPKLSVTCGL